MRLLLVFLFLMSCTLVSRGDNIFKTLIENDNLIVCVQQQIPDDLKYLKLRLKGGEKMQNTPVKNDDCKSMFYLNSKQAKQVKKEGLDPLFTTARHPSVKFQQTMIRTGS